MRAPIPDSPPLWRDRCGMPKLGDFPIRCLRALSHAGDHTGWCDDGPITWPGQGSPVPLCWGSTYRCWCPHNRPEHA